MSGKNLKIIPFGGLGEIGMNCLALEYEGDIVLVDCGVQFPDSSLPGVEFLCPDFGYVWERKDRLAGLVITHGHDDHIGGIPYLCKKTDVTIHCTDFPRGLITHKLKEHDLTSRANFEPVTPGKSFQVGPFEFTGIPVQHSIIEAMGFAIRTPVGVVVHSGDFKHDLQPFRDASTDLDEFKQFGDEGVKLLLCDSTNADKPGHTISEYDVVENLRGLMEKQTGRIFIGMFSSNIRRIEGILKVVKSQGKRLALIGRGLHHYTSLAHSIGQIEIPEDVLVLSEKSSQVPDDELVILVTGAQAEPQSALVRILQGSHPDVSFRPGDTVIFSSRFIPGNERNISMMINDLCRQGVDPIYEWHTGVHVSGHGYQEDLMELHRACRPDYFIPVHGEYRHMVKHAQMAHEMGMPREHIRVMENGDVLELGEDGLSFVEQMELDPVPIVLGTMMEQDIAVFKQRSGMAKAGIVACIVHLRGGRLVTPPSIIENGLLYRTGADPESSLAQAKQEVVDVITESNERGDELAEAIRLRLRRHYRGVGSYKPIVITKVLDD